MKRNQIFIFLLLLLGCQLQVYAQLKKADKLFEQYQYGKAIRFYERAVDSNDEQTKQQATTGMANCYRMMNNMAEARSWYSRAIEFENTNPKNYYYLGVAYRVLGEYDKAADAFTKYVKLVPNDIRGQEYAEHCRIVADWNAKIPSAEIRNVHEINSECADFAPTFFNGSILFASDRKYSYLKRDIYHWTNFGYLDLYEVEPSLYKDYWNQMKEVKAASGAFNHEFHDGPVCFSTDRKQVFITRAVGDRVQKDSANYRTHNMKLFYGEYNDNEKIKFKSFPYNDDHYSLGHATLSPDGNKLIVSSDKPGGYGESDLYVSEFKNGEWSELVNLGEEINTFGDEVFPYWADEETVFFSSDGHVGYGGLDLFECKINGQKCFNVRNLQKPLNSSYDDFSIVFNEGMKEGLFSSNREGGKGSDDIYVFRNFQNSGEIVDIEQPLIVSGYVKDQNTLEPINDASVFFLNANENQVLVLKTDEQGYFETEVDRGDHYIAKAMKNGYFHDCLGFQATEEDTVTKMSTPRDLLLHKYEINEVFAVENIYYDLDKSFIREDAKPPLENLVRLLKQYPINVELGSHTDCRASFQYNIDLSQRRAEAAVRYIIMRGIDPKRITAKGYGETMLVNRCADGVECTEEEHQANRRTEFKITSLYLDEADSNIFDPSAFDAGDIIPLILLPKEFYKGCLD
ncbi:tetratricopeptide repeat protein [Puteibacter caeruleilacunae]|nr:tetratricopeptide repeat protein [Puteibacter caeruleilacunae]